MKMNEALLVSCPWSWIDSVNDVRIMTVLPVWQCLDKDLHATTEKSAAGCSFLKFELWFKPSYNIRVIC